ncbi:hypothetical protein [Dysgonomonas sp. 511]|uniref:hypothetical protein n=1 Tax=Dysgonomonas sp. 511 TaxID=2302930 RepID=UPI0013D44DF2|nr:hypothetical protein [Dysgonomonas sp. 511]
MKKMFFPLLMTIILMTSCGSISKTGYVAPFARTEVHTDVLKADLDISKEKVEAKASSSYLFGFWRVAGDNKFTEAKDAGLSNSIFGGRIDKVKSAAMYKALQQSDADMLITPRYDTETKSYLLGLFKTYKVKVSGYNAKVKDLHQIEVPIEKTVRTIGD